MMKIIPRLLSLFATALAITSPLSAKSPAKPASPEASQAEALTKYPELGKAGSEFNKAFVERMKALRTEKPDTFKDPAWPMKLADEVAVERVSKTSADAAKDARFTNTLGMKFVSVPETKVLFCIHEVRRQDYAAFATEISSVDGSWKNAKFQGIPSGDKDDHPVVSVSLQDAQAFCAWLSKKEGKIYRLPSDREWSYAVGIGQKEIWTKDTTPLMRDRKVKDYPWDGSYPPKTDDKVGNYNDASYHEKFPDFGWVEGYADGFVTTAPVMSFKPNKLGLYDLGGNVWEWCQDRSGNPGDEGRVTRGGSFGSCDWSSFRPISSPAERRPDLGFRVVLEVP